jgi:NAD+ synthase (glutamine-hydrolysing)
MIRLGLAQIDATVGDVAGNLQIVREWMECARRQAVQLLVFPEMALSGYPAEDLLLREDFLAECGTAAEAVAAASGEVIVVVGFPERAAEDVFNAAAVCHRGRIHGIYRKAHLPNYGVFDERRYFAAPPPHEAATLLRLGGNLVGLTICEDIWNPGPPMAEEAAAGADLVVNISASPYRRGIVPRREQMLATRCRDNLCSIAYCNLVGGQDELIFDGASMVLDHEGKLVARAAQYTEELLVVDVDLDRNRAARLHDTRRRTWAPSRTVPVLADLALAQVDATTSDAATGVAPLLDPEAEVYGALVIGVRDYVAKTGFSSVVLGLSGGVDSALVALVATDALGPEHVTCVVMPSRHSSAVTQADARQLASSLGVDCREIRIDSVVDAYSAVLVDHFRGTAADTTEENLQARVRGNLLMALSNKFGWLLLTTGNKSEMSVGYATLYGDMAGGFAVLKDVPKQLVFALTRWRNHGGGPVPQSVIDRHPTAELRPNQRDTDTLPPYDVLDPILARYVECDESPSAILPEGVAADVVDRVITLVDRAEYKRRQAPPGIKITARAFGRDRRMPVVNRFRTPPTSRLGASAVDDHATSLRSPRHQQSPVPPVHS